MFSVYLRARRRGLMLRLCHLAS